MKKYDLIVAGGGLAGVGAAVCAARQGISVLLIEKSGCLGGAICNNLVYPFTNYYTFSPEDNKKQYLNLGIFKEMRDREEKYRTDLCEPKGKPEYQFKPEYYKLLLDDMVVEAGVDVLFHTTLTEVNTNNGKIEKIMVATPSGNLALEAKFYIDSTGNGDLLAMAGCEFQLGRESDGLCQPMTACFRMSGVNIEKYKKDHNRLNALYKQWQAEGKLINPRNDILIFYGIGEGILHFNTTRVIKHNPIDVFDLSKAEIEARKQINELVRFLKANSDAFKDSTVISIANEIGVRESRKLKGEHILDSRELKEMVEFEDSIAVGNYDIDIHSPDGGGTSHYYFKKGEYYQIPYKCLITKSFDNLLASGRCISATHEAQASVRVMPICACTGQAAGVAAAIAKKTNATVHTVDIKTVQKVLEESGAKIR